MEPNIKHLRYHVVLMFQIPQIFSMQPMMQMLLNDFPELTGSAFQSLPNVPDDQFPIITILSEKLNVNISKVNIDFDFMVDDTFVTLENIEQSINRVSDYLQKSGTSVMGPYRLGIIIYGGPTSIQSYYKIVKNIVGIDMNGKNWVETNYGIRLLYGLKINEKPIDINVWKRMDFDCESGRTGFTIDVNVNPRKSIDYSAHPPLKVWEVLKRLVGECINAFNIDK